MEARNRTLLYILFAIILLGVGANIIAILAWLWFQTPVIILVAAIFDVIFISPISLAWTIYITLIFMGQKAKEEILVKDLFREVNISN